MHDGYAIIPIGDDNDPRSDAEIKAGQRKLRAAA
jgi:hypothetical protein